MTEDPKASRGTNAVTRSPSRIRCRHRPSTSFQPSLTPLPSQSATSDNSGAAPVTSNRVKVGEMGHHRASGPIPKPSNALFGALEHPFIHSASILLTNHDNSLLVMTTPPHPHHTLQNPDQAVRDPCPARTNSTLSTHHWGKSPLYLATAPDCVEISPLTFLHRDHATHTHTQNHRLDCRTPRWPSLLCARNGAASEMAELVAPWRTSRRLDVWACFILCSLTRTDYTAH